MHPYFEQHPTLILLDGFLYAIVEKDPDTSLKKPARYNIYKLARALRHLTRKKK